MIGRVGQSGLATGPHLDYRLKKNGAWVNPVLEHRRMPPGAPIPDAELPAYLAGRAAALEGLDDAGDADACEEYVGSAVGRGR